MCLHFFRAGFIAGLFSLLFLSVSGQEVLVSDAEWPVIQAREVPRSVEPTSHKTATVLSLPFFDDFSYDSLAPSQGNWFMPDMTRVPGVSNTKGTSPPTKGVLTFDGAAFDGRKYNTRLESGICDSLLSCPIDLSANSIADSLYFSFFVEPGGLGEPPESSDSLVLYFDTTGNYNFRRVWGARGGTLPVDTFSFVILPLDSAEYFNPNFRFKFISYGAQIGEVDVWHVDYVYLNANRTRVDTSFTDVSVIGFLTPILNPYTTVPYMQLDTGFMQNFTMEISSEENSAVTADLEVNLRNISGNPPLVGTTSQSVPGNSLPPYANRLTAVPAFSDQSGTSPFILEAEAILSSNGTDNRPENDTLTVQFPIDSLLGYDDGESDVGYGLTSARSFCQEYILKKSDTLTGVWINFAPTLFFNNTTSQSTCMENASFTLTIWKELHPDSVLSQQITGSNVSYSDSGVYRLNSFVRFPLRTPLPVPDTFWVGIEQADNKPIGVGFDRNYDNSSRIYFENLANEFVNTTQNGTLMIRCEFGTVPPSVGIKDPRKNLLAGVRVFPQPANDAFRIRFQEQQALGAWQIRLMDLQGREVATWDRHSGAGRDYNFQLPAGLSNGLYLLNLEGTLENGKPFSHHQKLMVRQ